MNNKLLKNQDDTKYIVIQISCSILTYFDYEIEFTNNYFISQKMVRYTTELYSINVLHIVNNKLLL